MNPWIFINTLNYTWLIVWLNFWRCAWRASDSCSTTARYVPSLYVSYLFVGLFTLTLWYTKTFHNLYLVNVETKFWYDHTKYNQVRCLSVSLLNLKYLLVHWITRRVAYKALVRQSTRGPASCAATLHCLSIVSVPLAHCYTYINELHHPTKTIYLMIRSHTD